MVVRHRVSPVGTKTREEDGTEIRGRPHKAHENSRAGRDKRLVTKQSGKTTKKAVKGNNTLAVVPASAHPSTTPKEGALLRTAAPSTATGVTSM